MLAAHKKKTGRLMHGEWESSGRGPLTIESLSSLLSRSVTSLLSVVSRRLCLARCDVSCICFFLLVPESYARPGCGPVLRYFSTSSLKCVY